MSEAGLYRVLSPHFGCGFNLRFVKISYAFGGRDFAADSFGGEFMLNLLF